jgi:hypothetical protein
MWKYIKYFIAVISALFIIFIALYINIIKHSNMNIPHIRMRHLGNCQAKMYDVGNAVYDYYTKYHVLPTDLNTLIEKGYIKYKWSLYDEWKGTQLLKYVKENNVDYNIISVGPDGVYDPNGPILTYTELTSYVSRRNITGDIKITFSVLSNDYIVFSSFKRDRKHNKRAEAKN